MENEFSAISINAEEVMSHCCWCGELIQDDKEMFGLGAKARQGVDLSPFEGEGIEIKMPASGRKFYALVPASDSDARKDGNDLMFVACSNECAYELKNLINKEIELGDILSDIHDIGE